MAQGGPKTKGQDGGQQESLIGVVTAAVSAELEKLCAEVRGTALLVIAHRLNRSLMEHARSLAKLASQPLDAAVVLQNLQRAELFIDKAQAVAKQLVRYEARRLKNRPEQRFVEVRSVRYKDLKHESEDFNKITDGGVSRDAQPDKNGVAPVSLASAVRTDLLDFVLKGSCVSSMVMLYRMSFYLDLYERVQENLTDSVLDTPEFAEGLRLAEIYFDKATAVANDLYVANDLARDAHRPLLIELIKFERDDCVPANALRERREHDKIVAKAWYD